MTEAPAATGPTALPPETRASGTVRANRAVLLLLGLLLTAAGAAALAAGFSRLSDEPVIGGGVQDFVDASPWFWPVVGLAGLVLALLCIWWLLAQARSDRVGEVRLTTDVRNGHTDLAARALTDAVAAEVESYRGVTGASAHLSGSSAAPRLSLTVGLDGRVAPGEIHTRLVGQALAHARQALGRERLPARIELQLPRSGRRDVR